MRRTWMSCFVVAALAVIALPVRGEEAAEAIELKYKFKVGQEQRLTSTTTGKGTTKVIGAPGQQGDMTIPMDTMHEILIVVNTKAVDEQGNADVEFSFDAMNVETTAQNQNTRMEWTADGVKMEVNGKAVDAPEQLSKVLGFIGKAFKMKMSPRGKIVSAEWDSLKEMQSLMPGMNLKQMMESSQAHFPDKPVKPGDSWVQVQEMAMPGQGGQTGAVNVNMEYTYLGMETFKERQCAKLEISGTVSMDGVQTDAGASGMFVPPGAKVSIDGMHIYMDGFLYFDPEVGDMVEQQLNMDLSVASTVSGKAGQGANAQEFEISTETDMKMTTVTKVEDGPAAETEETEAAPAAAA